MADTEETTRPTAKRRIALCPDRVPNFGRRNRADEALAVNMMILRANFDRNPRRTCETSEEGLSRLKFTISDTGR